MDFCKFRIFSRYYFTNDIKYDIIKNICATQKIDTKSSKSRLIYAAKLKFDFACGSLNMTFLT